jgi:hypothetical protein
MSPMLTRNPIGVPLRTERSTASRATSWRTSSANVRVTALRYRSVGDLLNYGRRAYGEKRDSRDVSVRISRHLN